MTKNERLAALEARVADLEAKLYHRDWAALPPAYNIPTQEVPTEMAAYYGPALDEWRDSAPDLWRPGVYV